MRRIGENKYWRDVILKKFVGLVSILMCITLLFSGCVNATYEFKIHRNGSADAKYKILFDSKTADAEIVNALVLEFRKHFTEDKYEVSEYEEDGFTGIKVVKRDVSPGELAVTGKAGEENVDYSSELLQGLVVTEGVFADSFQLDSSIDLTFLTEDFLKQKKAELLPDVQKELTSVTPQQTAAASVYQNSNVTIIDKTDKAGTQKTNEIYEKKNVTVDDKEVKDTSKPSELQQAEAKKEGVNKLLANATLKVVMKFPDKVISSNAGKITDHGKTLEWILIPGTVNKITAKGHFTNTMGFAMVWLCIGLVVLAASYLIYRAMKKAKHQRKKKEVSYDRK